MHTQKSFYVVKWEPWNFLCHVFHSNLNGSLSWRTTPIFPSLALSFLLFRSDSLSFPRFLSWTHTIEYKNQKVFFTNSKEFVEKTLFKLNYMRWIAKKRRKKENKKDFGAWANWNQHTTTTKANKNEIIYK